MNLIYTGKQSYLLRIEAKGHGGCLGGSLFAVCVGGYKNMSPGIFASCDNR